MLAFQRSAMVVGSIGLHFGPDGAPSVGNSFMAINILLLRSKKFIDHDAWIPGGSLPRLVRVLILSNDLLFTIHDLRTHAH